MQFSIGVRMLIGFLAVILLTVAISVVAAVQLSRLGSILDFLAGTEVPEMTTVWNIKDLLSRVESDIGHTLLGHDVEEHLISIEQRKSAISESLDRYQMGHQPMAAEEAGILEALLIHYESFVEASTSITALVEQGRLAEAQALFHGRWYDIYEAAAESLSRLLDFELIEVGVLVTDAKTRSFSARNVIGTLALAGAFLSLAFALGITASVTKPIGKLIEVTERVARGDLTAKADIVRTDEIGVLATRFNAMLDQLNKSISDQRRFYADASHELRTPLTAIRGEAEVALRGPKSVADYGEALEHIVAVTYQMGTLIDELLFLARSDAGHDEYDMSAVALAPLLDEVAGHGKSLAAVKGVELDVDLGTSAVVWGDSQRLRQMFASLIDNAIKYTEPGGTVTLALEAESDRVRVLVSDTGIGMIEDELPHVFERFYRGDTAKMMREDGTGLGLSIAASVVKAHGGEILVDSTLGRGTDVSVRLPRNPPRG